MGWLKVKVSATVQPLVKFDLNRRIHTWIIIYHCPENYPAREDAQDSDLAPSFEDLSQSEKMSEIKPPLHK